MPTKSFPDQPHIKSRSERHRDFRLSVVIKPNDSNALFVKLDFTVQVVRLGKVASIARTIQLDSEMSFGTKEIDDAISDRNLASKLQPA
jgi:hypothetical protein